DLDVATRSMCGDRQYADNADVIPALQLLSPRTEQELATELMNQLMSCCVRDNEAISFRAKLHCHGRACMTWRSHRSLNHRAVVAECKRVLAVAPSPEHRLRCAR